MYKVARWEHNKLWTPYANKANYSTTIGTVNSRKIAPMVAALTAQSGPTVTAIARNTESLAGKTRIKSRDHTPTCNNLKLASNISIAGKPKSRRASRPTTNRRESRTSVAYTKGTNSIETVARRSYKTKLASPSSRKSESAWKNDLSPKSPKTNMGDDISDVSVPVASCEPPSTNTDRRSASVYKNVFALLYTKDPLRRSTWAPVSPWKSKLNNTASAPIDTIELPPSVHDATRWIVKSRNPVRPPCAAMYLLECPHPRYTKNS